MVSLGACRPTGTFEEGTHSRTLSTNAIQNLGFIQLFGSGVLLHHPLFLLSSLFSALYLTFFNFLSALYSPARLVPGSMGLFEYILHFFISSPRRIGDIEFHSPNNFPSLLQFSFLASLLAFQLRDSVILVSLAVV